MAAFDFQNPQLTDQDYLDLALRFDPVPLQKKLGEMDPRLLGLGANQPLGAPPGQQAPFSGMLTPEQAPQGPAQPKPPGQPFLNPESLAILQRGMAQAQASPVAAPHAAGLPGRGAGFQVGNPFGLIPTQAPQVPQRVPSLAMILGRR